MARMMTGLPFKNRTGLVWMTLVRISGWGMLLIVLLAGQWLHADDKSMVIAYLDEHYDAHAGIARELWNLAELGYQETESSRRLQTELGKKGFELEPGVADIPTAFVASYGTGKPVIGILAEFDALPGISQAAEPVRKILDNKPDGHACGHHLFGTGSTAAALALKNWLAATGTSGTIKLFGTPAEEGGSGKVYLVRAGLFDDVDVVLHWHPADSNNASPETSLANKSAKFRFSGVSSHASSAPERGRSALDGVEAMNYMANMMREHIPSESRLHYVITKGGSAPNVVPDFAEVYYYLRHPQADELLRIWDRLVSISKGAAMGTGTQVNMEVIHGNHSLLPNLTLAKIMDSNLRLVGGVSYTKEETRFAEKLAESFGSQPRKLNAQEKIKTFKMRHGKGSTDVGDVSWVVPTVGLRAATWVPGTSAHSWQAIAAGGTSIGSKGMQVAAKTLALTAVDLFQSPQVIAAARQELLERRGKDFEYEALLGDRGPPLDYRN
jgi:aminobenzoyl-glutamate utilization protein B